jgi:hypothetical protein
MALACLLATTPPLTNNRNKNKEAKRESTKDPKDHLIKY